MPVAVFGGPLAALKAISSQLYRFTGLTLVSPFTVTFLPRLVALLLSFSADFAVYQICVLYKHSFNRCLATLASSYVVLLYSSRTLTNTLELVLFSWLFYLVAAAMKRSSEVVLLQSLVKEEYSKAETVRERVKLRRKEKRIPQHDFIHFLPISVICAVGFFNRPTFVAFALVPVFFWLQRGLQVKSYFQPFITIHFRIASLAPGKVRLEIGL